MKQALKQFVPTSIWQLMKVAKRACYKGSRRFVEACGYNIAKKSDYYSPLPTESHIHKNVKRWYRPSALAGLSIDVESYKRQLTELCAKYFGEFDALPKYEQNRRIGFGPGYTEVDAAVLYMMLRDLKPRQYLEVGSGLSTHYCSIAAQRNAEEQHPLQITCIEPYPFEKLFTIPNIQVIKDEVQNVPHEVFQKLQAGDVLFIDSSHVLKIDGDVAYLYLEILPILNPGVIIHIHDIAFPYNIPFPAELWVLGQAPHAPYWPIYWNEAMLLQAFLAFNQSFQITLSAPLIRYYDEQFLKELLPCYQTVAENSNAFGSIWLKRVS